jgi:hypothetical protein
MNLCTIFMVIHFAARIHLINVFFWFNFPNILHGVWGMTDGVV